MEASLGPRQWLLRVVLAAKEFRVCPLADLFGEKATPFIVWISLAVGAMVPAHAQEFARARERIREVMVADNVPSIAVAVSRDGKILWEEGFGWADLRRRIAATAHTQYSLASISKPLTATALMVLVKRGQIDLDKPIEDYLGGLKLTAHVGSSRDATVRRVANHTSGLPTHVQFFYADEALARPSMEESIRRHGVLMDAPGATYTYSNFGYALLERAIEQVSGKSYAVFVQEAIFRPLGLNQSVVPLTSDANGRSAVRYASDGSAIPFYDFDSRGAAAVYMSAHDLARFGIFHLRGSLPGQRQVLAPGARLAMREGERDYGIGWSLKQLHGLKAVWHTGSMPGVATRLTLFPDADIAIVLLANASTTRLYDIETDIVHALLPATIRTDHGFKPQVDVVGRWKGAITTDGELTPIQLIIEDNGRVCVRIGNSQLVEVERVGLDKNGVLLLEDIPGSIVAPEARRYAYQIGLKLKPRGNILNGAAVEMSRRFPHLRSSALSYWVELERVAPAGSHESQPQ